MPHIIRAGVFLTALNFLAGHIPGLMPELSRMIGFLAFLVWAGSYLPLKATRSYLSILAIVALLLSFPLLLSETTFLFGMSLCIFGLSVLCRSDHPKADLSLFLLTTVCYATFTMAYSFSPHLWHLLQRLSLAFSAETSAMVGNKMTLGATAMGLPITISVLCHCVSLFCLSRAGHLQSVESESRRKGKKRKKRSPEKEDRERERTSSFLLPPSSFILTLVAIVGMNLIWLWLQSPLVAVARFFNKGWNPTPLDFQVVLLLLLIIPLYPLIRKVRFVALPLEFPTIHLRRAASGLFLVFLSLLILICHPEGHNPRGGILFCDKGANWAVPFYGKTYGQHSAGMFGILPNYLNLRGYETSIHKGTLRGKDLKGVGVVAVFNPTAHFSGPEKQLIYQFIEAGGSLLIAGDHTDVTGVMGPINDLLTPFSISLNFDTALPISSGWVHSLEKRPHPITKGIKADYETSIWVGASLKISPPARPVIVGKSGWADIGNYLNKKRAFLGNYKRSSDEQLGDVVLVAESVHGKGKVLVFGDTSTFQNGVVTSGYPFLERIFHWLSSRENQNYPGGQSLLACLLLVAAGYLLTSIPGTTLLLLSLLAMHIPLWVTGLQAPPVAEAPDVSSKYGIAYIDISHNERFSLFASAEESTWGISLNLMRNRHIPLFMKNFSERALSETSLLFVIAPTRKFCRKEIHAVRRFMENGGNVVWSVGWEEAEASKSFLEEFAFSIDAVPRGPAEADIGPIKAKFLEAWPIIGGDESRQVIAEKYDYPMIVYQPVGKGGLLIIGDSEFLHSRNIESYKTYDLNNIRFFKYLLDKLET